MAHQVKGQPSHCMFVTALLLGVPGCACHNICAYHVSGLLLQAHCVSDWGHDFRPAYLELASLKQDFPNTPIAALTVRAAAPAMSSGQQAPG
jgi:hypothetical protein